MVPFNVVNSENTKRTISAVMKMGRDIGARNFQVNWIRSGYATTSRVRRPPKKLEQSTTALAPHQSQDIETKCTISYFDPIWLISGLLNSTAASTGLNLAWTRQAACDWACADGDSSAWRLNNYESMMTSMSSLLLVLDRHWFDCCCSRSVIWLTATNTTETWNLETFFFSLWC